MPTYDYICRACGHEFEIHQPITANPSRKCPKCGKLSLRRLIGKGAGLIFKGSGFYETDYKRSPASSKSEQSPAESTKAKDTKPAAPAQESSSPKAATATASS